jgi:tRNA(fMet)-specific endonuclease VapC
MKILLDTSAYVGFKRGVDEIVDIMVHSESILISPIVLGELMFGFRHGTKLKKNLAELNEFMDHESVHIAHFGEVTADRYSRIALQLKKRGTPIFTNDIWIAAQTLEHGAELVTSDGHFENIAGLVYTLVIP